MSTTPPQRSDDAPPRVKRPRGERLWHAAVEPLFLISGQRRLLYANPAWEKLTGVSFAEARGRACRRRGATTASEPWEQVLAALAPPPEALQGQPCQTRRRAPGKKLAWWDVDFFPWADATGPAAILGKIRVIAESGPAHAALPEKLVQLRQHSQQVYRLESWSSEVPVMQRLSAQLRLAAASPMPALLQGPAGSGKTWAARTIHHLGDQHESFFASLDARLPAAVLADTLAASQHWRLGTLYLSNVERLPRDMQALLVQRLETETSEPEPRLLAGTSADLDEEVRAGRLLPQLHCRLSALTIQVPALSERLADLPRLLEQMLPRAGAAAGHGVRSLSAAAQDSLRHHAWPGNLRELYDVLVLACQRAKSDRIDLEDLSFYLHNPPAPPDQPLALDATLEKVERRLIGLALRLAQGNKTRAAELLGIWRPRLLRRLEQLGLQAPENGAEAPPIP